MRLALVHDDIVQWGGAERVLLAITEIYPDAPIFTSLYDEKNPQLKEFKNKKIITSFMQKIPGWKRLYKALLPLYPVAFEQFNFDGFDLVISHTTRFAKSIITKPETRHISYCHTPPRFLWHFSGEAGYGLGELLMTKLRLYDAVSANRVDHFIAGSKNAQKRIEKIYRRESKVVYPFVDLERFKGIEPFDGGYYICIGRPNKYKQSLKFSLRSNYKNFGLAERVCEKLRIPLKIIQGQFSEEMVVQVLAGCRALIVPGIEDFGLASLEAQGLGKPVIAYAQGGVLETVIDGKTGTLFPEQTEESLMKALQRLESININPDDCRANAAKFSREEFLKNFRQTVASLV